MAIQTVPEAHRDWWLFVVRGLVSLAVGAFAFARPADVFFTVLAFAALAILAGILVIAHAVRLPADHGRGRWFMIAEGLAGITIGGFAFEYVHKTMFLAYTIAMWALVIGAMMLAFSIVLRREIPLAWLWGLVGIVFGILGFAIVLAPGAVTLGPSYIIGLIATIVGLGLIVLGLSLRAHGAAAAR